MGKPSPPAPTDPVVAANAQGAANADTARLQARLNNVDTSGPQGTVVYNETSPDRWSQTTTLSPAEQSIFNQSTAAQSGALGIANDQLGRIGGALGQGLTPGQMVTGVGNQQLRNSFDHGPNIQTQIGNQDINQSVRGVQDAYYNQATSRLDPQWNTADSQLRTRLANQGLNENDLAYQNAYRDFNNAKTDAYNQANYGAIQAGAGEQNTLFGQQAAQGQFANQAAGQIYGQNQGQADFYNQAANQGIQNQIATGTFTNQAQQQALQQQAYIQNQPINQFSALLGSGQVSMPQGVNYTPTSVAPTDVLGAYALNQQQRNANYQAQVGQQGGLLGGLFSLGSAAIGLSDRRLKRDIVKLDELPDGLGVYAFRYLWSPIQHVGVMAQEVAKLRPWALRSLNGWLAVDYGAL